MIFCKQIMTLILKYMQKRKTHIGAIVSTGYSFEEWFNWEAFSACIDAKLNAEPKPLYSRYGLSKAQKSGDLMVTNEKESVLIEFGLVHDWTGDKWLEKLESDRNKLFEANDSNPRKLLLMQSLVLASTDSNFIKDARWYKWLDRLSFWHDDYLFNDEFNLIPNGKMLIRSWCL